MRVLVCGGRDYLNCAAVYKELDRINVVTPITLIIHGAAPGADILGCRYCDHGGLWTYRNIAGGNSKQV